MAQQLAKALHNRQPKAGAAIVGVAFAEATEFLEDFLL